MVQIDFKLKGKSGIYSILNVVNGKRYIGSSVDIYSRLHEHFHNLRNNKSHNKHLQSSWNKYGEENFIFNVLEFCESENRFDREQFYLDMLKPEYNFASLVVANFGRDMSIEQREKISETLKSKYASGELIPYTRKDILKECWIYDITSWTLQSYCKTYTDAAKVIGVDRDTISTEKIKNRIYKNKFIILREPLRYIGELKNIFFKNFSRAKSKGVSYIITIDENETWNYYRSYEACSKVMGVSSSTLKIHKDATRENPYIKNGISFFTSNEYIPIYIAAVPIEKSLELSSGNIGESPTDEDNTEISTETKESVPSYSVDGDPLN